MIVLCSHYVLPSQLDFEKLTQAVVLIFGDYLLPENFAFGSFSRFSADPFSRSHLFKHRHGRGSFKALPNRLKFAGEEK